MNIAIITGASSGLGATFFRTIENRHSIDEFWLLGRDQKQLDILAKSSPKSVRTFSVDLADRSARENFINKTQEFKGYVKILINSAGFGMLGPFTDIVREDNKNMVAVNCEAMVDLCHAFLPRMQAGSSIINIASVAAFLPQTNFSVYAATKAFVLHFSEALAEEVAEKGIRVLAVCPNPMHTKFFERAGDVKGNSFKMIGYETPEAVVKKALSQLDKHRRTSISHPIGHLIRVFAKICPHRIVTWGEKFIL